MRAVTRRLALAAGVGLALSPPDAAAFGSDRALVRRLQRRFELMAREEGVSGAILLARHGEPIFRAAYGDRNRAEGLANRVDTKFNLASIGKMFTSLAVLRLVEAGRLRLSDKLGDAWPEYPNRDVATRISIEQLLTHTAGVGNYWAALAQKPPQNYVSLRDTLALFVNDPLEQAPGSFSYSNGGYVILGCLVERITGEDFFVHCRRTIFEPLGMSSTDSYRADDIVPNLALGYLRDPERQGVWRNNVFDVFRGTSAGGNYSTLGDMLRFATALQREELLSRDMTAEWTRGRVDYQRGRYGYGISESTINGHRIIGHSGGHMGIANELMIFPDLGYTAIVLTNGEVENFWALERVIKEELAGADDASRNYWFTRDLISRIAENAAAGDAFYAERGERSAREGVIDVYGHRYIHEGRAAVGLALLAFNRRAFPDSLAALWGLAEGYRHAGATAEAIGAYREFLVQQPGDADALRYIAQLGG